MARSSVSRIRRFVIVNMLHGSPGCHNTVSWTEGEVVEVLVKWMARSSVSRIRRFVDQHTVDCANIGPSEALDIVKNFWQTDILRKNIVPHKVLDLVVDSLVGKAFLVFQ